MLSRRIQNIKESGIRKVFSLAQTHGNDLINLSMGQPHFPTPKTIKNAAISAIKNDFNAYTPTSGLPELKEKICKKLNSKNNIKASIDEIMITNGVSGALFLIFSALFNEDDEVLIPDPYFVSYKQISDFYNIKSKYINTYPNLKLSPENLEKHITKDTKALILNSPANPSGLIYNKEELIALSEIAKKYDLWIISDEIYEIFDYDNKFFSVGSVYDKTITLNGFSKSHSITGWRLGYIHAPKNIIEAMSNLQQYTFVCAPSLAQKAIADNFEINLSTAVDYYKKNRDILYEKLKENFKFPKPEGAFYAYIKIPKGRNNYIEELIKNKLLVIPSGVFSENKEYFRLSFAVDRKTLIKGIGILKNSL